MSEAGFNRTNDNIEWARWTWNPVTGCKTGCPYCYARDIALQDRKTWPRGFEPDFRQDRLSAPQHTRVPSGAELDPGLRSVFVCSMADLFGDWIPQEWIEAVLAEVRRAPQWTFLFLTKFPARLVGIEWPANAWVGTTVDRQERVKPAEEAFQRVKASVKFLSCEPLLEELTFSSLEPFNWLIIGARSSTRKLPAFQPDRAWLISLMRQARQAGVKVYVKPNVQMADRPREYPQAAPVQGRLL